MFGGALEFLDEEREDWRPFEALAALPDERLERPVEAAHGWSGRELMAHLTAWQEVALAIARELAVGESSPTLEQAEADWDSRGGEVINAEILETWAALPIDEVRRRFLTVPGELRGYLTVVPETRWVKHPRHMDALLWDTLYHYADHRADLEAILATA